jgi:hypothetical protein
MVIKNKLTIKIAIPITTHCLIAVLAAQLGTPRGRYDEHSGKFSLSMKPRFNQTSMRKKPLMKVDTSWLWRLLQRIYIWRLSGV